MKSSSVVVTCSALVSLKATALPPSGVCPSSSRPLLVYRWVYCQTVLVFLPHIEQSTLVGLVSICV
jgi:hypothetical protein